MDDKLKTKELREIEEFLASAPWHDVRASIEGLLKDCYVSLEDPLNNLENIRFIQGELRTLKRVLEIPNILTSVLQSNSAEKGEE